MAQLAMALDVLTPRRGAAQSAVSQLAPRRGAAQCAMSQSALKSIFEKAVLMRKS